MTSKRAIENDSNHLGEDFEFIENLPQVFSTLLDLKKSIIDDTSLKKLSDILKKKLTTVEKVKRSGADCFLEKVKSNIITIEESVAVFAIGLTGILGSDETEFQTFNSSIHCICDSIWKCGRMEDPCITSAMFEALSHLTGHSAGLVWLVSENITDRAWTILENGRSLFLIQEAKNFMILMYSGILAHHTELQSMGLDSGKLVAAVLMTIENLLMKEGLNTSTANNTSSSIDCALSILKLICKSDRAELNNVLSLQNLMDGLLETFYSSSKDIFLSALDVLEVLCSEKLFTTSRFFQLVLEVPHKMLNKGSTWQSQKICVKLLNSCESLTVDQVQVLEKIVLFPLYAVLDRTPVNVKTAVEVKDKMVTSSGKSALTHLIWHTVDCTADISFKTVDKAELILDTFKGTLLQDATDDPKLESRCAQFLSQNRKVQQKILDYLQSCPADDKLDPGIFSSTLKLLTETGIDSLTLTKCLNCILLRLSLVLCADEEQGRQLAETLTKFMCHIKWEIRDSTAEFLGNVVQLYKDNNTVMEWISQNRLDIQVWQMVSDKESYVRATAISFTESLVQLDIMWNRLCSYLQKGGGPVETIIEIFFNDSEAFPRRRAVHFIKSLFLHRNDVYKSMDLKLTVVMTKAMLDFDWEVKSKSLEFWECVILKELGTFALRNCEGNVPDVPSRIFSQSEVMVHALSSLLTGADDYDQSVCARACQILQNTKQRIILPDDFTQPKKRKLDLEYKNNFENQVNEEKILKDTDENNMSSEQVLRRFYETEWQNLSEQFLTSSDDYSSNPMSLIQDILLELKEGDSEDNALDCY